jgi:hypothetical protein
VQRRGWLVGLLTVVAVTVGGCRTLRTPAKPPPPRRRRPRPATTPAPLQFSWDADLETLREEAQARCDVGDLQACDVHASMLRSGLGGPADQFHALQVADDACMRGHRPSCQLASAQRDRLRRMLATQPES